MKLKKQYASQDDIPEWAQGLYEEKDGAWHRREDVEFEGTGTDPKISEFRETNRQLKSDLDRIKSEMGEMTKRYEGVDPEEFDRYREQLAKVHEEEERKLIANGQLDEVVRRRTARLLDEKNAELENRTKAFTGLEAKYNDLASNYARTQAQARIESIIADRKLRVKPGAREDLATRITSDWTVNEKGDLQPRRQDLIGDSGAAIEPVEYVEKELLDKRSFFFEPAKGGGAGGNDDAEGGGGPRYVAADPVSFGQNLKDIAAGKAQVKRG
jgi:predicted secreted protein